jgi:hypothetical protein
VTGYRSSESELNAEGKNEGDAATRGMHAYYRNSTAGSRYRMRINKLSCARVEKRLEPHEIAAMLTPGR